MEPLTSASLKTFPTHAVRVGREDFPAWVQGNCFLVDLRVNGIFKPSYLRRRGVAEESIAAAAQSQPVPGFLLIERKTS